MNAPVLSMSFADDAPTLAVGLLRHRAGIDDTDMGFLPLSSGTDTLGEERATDGRGLSKVELTPEGVVGSYLV